MHLGAIDRFISEKYSLPHIEMPGANSLRSKA